jgi:hypothetical protein
MSRLPSRVLNCQVNFSKILDSLWKLVQLICVHLMFDKIPVLQAAGTEIYLISQTPGPHSSITQYFRRICTTFVFILPCAFREIALSNACS